MEDRNMSSVTEGGDGKSLLGFVTWRGRVLTEHYPN
jgi:hypothetical protein